MKFLTVILLVLSGCASVPIPPAQPCEAPVIPDTPDYPVYRLAPNAPNSATAGAYYESFSMCQTHAANLESLLKALKPH